MTGAVHPASLHAQAHTSTHTPFLSLSLPLFLSLSPPLSVSLSLSLSHTHTHLHHTLYMYVYICTYTHPCTHTLHDHHRYLTEHLPPPSTIPINVTLSVPEKNFIATDVLLKPEESMATILKKLRSLMDKEGLDILEFPACDEFEISIIRYMYT